MATATAGKPRTVQPPVVKDQPLFIGGKFVDSVSGKTFPAINPATGQTLCQVAEGDKADIDLAVQAARKALEQGPWGRLDAADRGRLVHALAHLAATKPMLIARLRACGRTVADRYIRPYITLQAESPPPRGIRTPALRRGRPAPPPVAR